jgi:hypothetical protein
VLAEGEVAVGDPGLHFREFRRAEVFLAQEPEDRAGRPAAMKLPRWSTHCPSTPGPIEAP